MQVIHYLNFTSQLFAAAADSITPVSTESAGLLRSMSAARHVHAAQLWAIAGQVRKGDAQDNHKEYWPTWNFHTMPPAIGSGAEVPEVVSALNGTIQTEKALQSAPYVISWTSQNPIFDGVVRASKTIVALLERVIIRLEGEQAKTWICTNCLNYASEKPEACPLCGVGSNWLKPFTRI